jgi:8-oxo-dGTP pyrophosphatase MutT (NUDIX family)
MKNPLLLTADRSRRAWWFVTRPFSLGVLALVVDEEGRILLVEQTYRSGWYLPGGSVRKREGLDDALRRELREEVGVEPSAPPRLHGVYWNFADRKSDYVAVFVVDSWQRRPAKSLEIARDAFFAPGELPEDTSPAARQRIGELVAGVRDVVAPW